MMGAEENYEAKLTTLVAEVRASNDVLHVQLKHIQELFSEKLDKIHMEYKNTSDIVGKHTEKIELLQEKFSEIASLREKVENLSDSLKLNKKDVDSNVDKIVKDIDSLKSETEVSRIQQKNPEFSRYVEIGKFVSNIVLSAAALILIYQTLKK